MSATDKPLALGWFLKSVYVVAIGCLLILGLIGLLLPIIPGILFLFLGLLLACKVSTRVHKVVSRHSGFRHLRQRWQRLGLLKSGDQIRLAFWYGVRTVMDAAAAGARALRR